MAAAAVASPAHHEETGSPRAEHPCSETSATDTTAATHASGHGTSPVPERNVPTHPGADCCAPAEAGLVADGGCTALRIAPLGAVGETLPSGPSAAHVPTLTSHLLPAAAPDPAATERLAALTADPPTPPFTLIAQHTLLLR